MRVGSTQSSRNSRRIDQPSKGVRSSGRAIWRRTSVRIGAALDLQQRDHEHEDILARDLQQRDHEHADGLAQNLQRRKYEHTKTHLLYFASGFANTVERLRIVDRTRGTINGSKLAIRGRFGQRVTPDYCSMHLFSDWPCGDGKVGLTYLTAGHTALRGAVCRWLPHRCAEIGPKSGAR